MLGGDVGVGREDGYPRLKSPEGTQTTGLVGLSEWSPSRGGPAA